MPNRFLRPMAFVWACIAGLASPLAQAQGYEVQAWPANQAVPALQATDLSGRVWRLSDLRGKAVLLNFWASWCAPCRAEMPSLQAMADFYGPDKLLVLTLNFKESAAVAQRFAQRADLRLPVLLDPQGQLARQWGATAFPTTVLIAADGQVRALVRGELDWTSLAAAQWVEPLLAPVSRPRAAK